MAMAGLLAYGHPHVFPAGGLRAPTISWLATKVKRGHRQTDTSDMGVQMKRMPLTAAGLPRTCTWFPINLLAENLLLVKIGDKVN